MKKNFLALVANLNEFRVMVRGIVLRSLAITIVFGAAAFLQDHSVSLDETVLTVSTVSPDGKSGGAISYDLFN